jgi:hypothetical protein
VESHRIDRSGVHVTADGESALLVGDGSAAQVGTLENQLIFSEKSNAIETVNLNGRGAIAGSAALVANIPSNVNAPFGLATRGNDAYVTIAHADEISLVRHDAVVTVTGSGTQHAPCWVTLDGPFLFSANSPSRSVSRYAVYGERIIQDAAIVTTFSGNPTDITYHAGLAAVIEMVLQSPQFLYREELGPAGAVEPDGQGSSLQSDNAKESLTPLNAGSRKSAWLWNQI